jgi:hypothetical protein
LVFERPATSDPGNAGWQRDVAASFSRLASVYRQSGDSAKTRDALRQGQAIIARLTKLSTGMEACGSAHYWAQNSRRRGMTCS